ncbi:BirA family transcriptional regulator, biotin operon repressor/biotin---[acetyl-CoA-carboxylase] ligase [Bathymodiolus japonicus methanotrophic gill symbiont]|uniref:bifunctional biotin--[acetyl-CoA-carboxylase] ligase/biotin operon repressor BirA n=1 Tax=Bathymodiolus japonicus methanotrophic gill symbiont TaxID=113269 RepID=UPI001B40934D|nr:bifunctional biotin--[acetyl-CoA-carboxylase] ligase/biotin operon repressor BirA [Bathymodiolus japonicus methanotrophic gill symbiont]GFO71194.1 BirA family transcriptional regulator, biotin operon repressor/biotin---[acetyl-CoA-carboxylase] ligase [Bathymodiolus japonicus methanotrophic gill symbiont]
MQFSANKKRLLQILADGQFHSGTDLAAKLDLSRSAIWKQINDLQEQGIAIAALNGKGYRLPIPLELLDKSQIFGLLNAETRQSLTELVVHDQIDSTNHYLVNLRNANPDTSAVVCLAEQQTAGKGRRGRQWVSPFGSNVYASIIWRFDEGPTNLSGLSLAIGVAVINALKIHGIHDAGLKWPNDIYWQQRKLGGILVEVSGEADGPCHAVIGLGLNLFLAAQHSAKIDQDWVDINEILGESHQLSRNELLATLIEQLVAVTRQYRSEAFALYRDQWRQFDCMQGQQVSLYMGNTQIDGTVLGINDAGLLILQTESVTTQSFASGEVSFRRI